MDINPSPLQRRRRGDEDEPRPHLLRLRNWLNIIFMLGAIAGVAVYFFADQTTGIIIVLAAMIFKMAEAALRFIH
jgi:hypothetical protein